MIKLNPRDYDYLWSDHDIDFIFVSCYLFKEFRKADIVLIYDHKDKELKFFLSKRDRRKYSKYAFQFYKKRFSGWKKSIKKNIERGKRLVNEHGYDDLRLDFKQRVKLFQDLESDYFPTEFFFMDYVEKSKDKAVIDNLKEMGRLKLEARKVLNNFYNHNIVFKPVLSKIKTDRKDLRWLSYEEIIRLIDGKKVAVSNRDKTDWILAKKTSWKVVAGKNAEALMKEFDDYFFKTRQSVFHGIIANKGLYRGKARVIKTVFSDGIYQETKNFRKGDILVAQTTGPELMHIVQKARAIVTDEGGLASHAAIVSRELGIPCIVGTKIATKMIKNGQVLEVDADSGVVRILKRA